MLLDASADRLSIYNGARARQRFVPASTFKIFNSLVALEAGVIKDENEVVPYGGQPQRMKAWEQDMDMRHAIRVSNVPVYQELARRIGLPRMRHYLALAQYGNADTGDMVDRFWLEGPLEISAIEQIDFLKRFVQRRLPFSERNITIVRDLLKQEETPQYAMFAKTGWADKYQPNVGWLVGWVERGEKVYPFAINIDMRSDKDAVKRLAVARACLMSLGLIS